MSGVSGLGLVSSTYTHLPASLFKKKNKIKNNLACDKL